MSFSKTYQRLLKERFLLVQCVQTGVLMATGDAISQGLVEKKGWKQYQARRTMEFAFLGSCLVGPAVTAWYKLLTKFGTSKNVKATVKKVAADQLIFAPGFLVIFIWALGLLRKEDVQEIKKRFDREYLDILLTNWEVWPLIQAVNFYFVPLKYQVLLVQSVAVMWNTYLSWKTHSDVD